MTKQPTWWDFAHKKEPDIRLLERILHSDDCDLYNRDQIKAIRLISIHAPVRGTTEHIARLWPHWFSRRSKYPTGYRVSITDLIFNAKGPKVWMYSIKPFYNYYITILAGMQAKP